MSQLAHQRSPLVTIGPIVMDLLKTHKGGAVANFNWNKLATIFEIAMTCQWRQRSWAQLLPLVPIRSFEYWRRCDQWRQQLLNFDGDCEKRIITESQNLRYYNSDQWRPVVILLAPTAIMDDNTLAPIAIHLSKSTNRNDSNLPVFQKQYLLNFLLLKLSLSIIIRFPISSGSLKFLRPLFMK